MKPVICNYYLTYRCNSRCGFCDIWRDRSVPASQESPPDVVCRNLDDVKRLGVVFVDFTGGEPLLYDGLPEVLDHARSLGLYTTVTTNGMCYPARAHEIAGTINILQFSLHGPDAATHDAVIGVPCFDTVVESVDISRSLGERPTFIHTVTNENIDRVPGVITLARSLRVPLYLNPCFSYFGNPGLLAANARRLEQFARKPGVVVDRGFLKFLADGGNRRESPRCLAVTSTIVISPDDRMLLPCYHMKTRALPINGQLAALRSDPSVQFERHLEGRHPYCEGCVVYCYVRTSLFRRPDRYFLPTALSGVKYLWTLFRAPRKPIPPKTPRGGSSAP